ncbi:MAG: Trans-aconitate 2-methyltransferase [Candidatus Heimdallarchaeota archaeon LC_2]|nr:MAG: Trans-aconitate 2-methyltransferase [Candidatus Heimdallarchaeota archaeon LC_2]
MSELDEKKVEEFGGKMLGLLNISHLTLLVSIGHRTGLFDSMSQMEPATSGQIAKSSGLNERYVREWLNAMVVGQVMDYNGNSKLYSLPKEHAPSLTRAGGLHNLAFFTQGLKTMAAVEDLIVDSFKNGGGVPYSNPDATEFLSIWNSYTSAFFDAMLIPAVLPIVPSVVSDLEKGMTVLDVGCGYGHSTNLIGKNFPNSEITGYDFSEIGIAAAKDETKTLGLSNVNFELQNIEEMNGKRKFNFITAFDCIHDQAKPALVLKRIAESLEDDGTFLMVDIKAGSNVADNMEHPAATWLYSVSTMHCMTVSLARDGEGLGNMWGREKAEEMLKEAGFNNVDVKEVEGDLFNYYYIAKKN